MKKTLSILLTAALLFSLFAAAPVTADAAGAEAYIEEIQQLSVKFLTADGQTKTYIYAVPKVSVDSAYAATINEKLYSHSNDQVARFEYAYSHQLAITPDVGYQCCLYGDILDIVLYTNNFNMLNYSMWEYKINVKTGEQVTNENVFAIAGITKAEADQKLIGLIEADLQSGGRPEAAYYAAYGQAYYDTVVNEKLPTVTHYYLDDGGNLRAMLYGTWKVDGKQIGYCINGALIKAYHPPYLLGDADGDGKVSVLDATAIQRSLAKLSVKSFHEKAADADEDGKLTVLDATAIQRWLAKLSTHAGIGDPRK